MDKRLFIINELRRLAQEIAPKPLRGNEFFRLSGITRYELRKHFGSWKAALGEAGIEASAPEPKRLTDDELMDAIGELWKAFGRRPTLDAMNYSGRYSVRPYVKRWGSFSKAVEHYIQLCGIPTRSPDSPSSEDTVPIPALPHRHPTPVQSVPLTSPKAREPRHEARFSES